MLNTNSIRPVWAEINLDNLSHNMREIKRLSAKDTLITAVIKADGYGHGAVGIAQTLLNAGADRFAVAVLDEAIELREAGINVPILVLGFTGVERVSEIIKYDIEQTLYHFEVAQALSDEAKRQGKNVKIHIKIDSGMGRIGFLPIEGSIETIKSISKLPNIVMEGIFTHFAVADEVDKTYTKEQIRRFDWVCNSLKTQGVQINIKHCANSATIIDMPENYFNMVRAGIIMYGLAPSKDVMLERIDIKPVMTLKAHVTNIKVIKKGETVSYGRKFMAEADTIIASLGIGYADGYTRMLSGKAEVLIKGQRAKVVGNICMDQCMIDITKIANVELGDEVVLFGKQGDESLLVDELASKIGTINYEMVCMIARRVPRVYIKNNEVVNIINFLY